MLFFEDGERGPLSHGVGSPPCVDSPAINVAMALSPINSTRDESLKNSFLCGPCLHFVRRSHPVKVGGGDDRC